MERKKSNSQPNIKELIALLESSIGNPTKGLPEDMFLFISRITPLVNVDLLIQNEHNHTLLTWRDDAYYPTGWHVPGGILRFKETASDRIKAVAASELGAGVNFEKEPLAINEVIRPCRGIRGHFIALLYKCTLISPLNKNLKYEKGIPKAGEWAWHEHCPDDIISIQEVYRKFM